MNAGGTERQIVQMAELMRQSGNEVQLAVLRGTEWLNLETSSLPVHFAGFRSLSRPDGWAALLELVRWMRRQRFDILQTFFVESNLLGPWLGRLARIPVVLGSRRNMNYWMSGRTALFQSFSNKLATRLVANCEAVKKVIAQTERTSLGKIDVIYNGVDLSAFTADAAERERVRRKFGITEAQVLVGSISTLRPIKGVTTLIEAAAIVITQQPSARFLLVGDGPLRPQLEEMVTATGLRDHVFFAGSQNDVTRYLRAFDIAVLASESEGFSNSVLEYVAMGLPSVVTDVGGNKEALGDGGLLVPPKDAPALAKALLRLITDQDTRRRMSDAGLAHANRFSLENAKHNLNAYYHSLIKDQLKPFGGTGHPS